MFVIPCKYFDNNPLIFKCLDSIRKFHQDPIVVVDNGSDNLDYLNMVSERYKNVFTEKNEISGYEFGALSIAYEKYDFKEYFLMHDSMFLNSNIDHVKNKEVLSTRYFNSWNGIGGTNLVSSNGMLSYRYGYDNQQQMNIVHSWNNNTINKNIPYSFEGVFGSSFYSKREVLDLFKKDKLFEYIPRNKLESQAMERFLGIILKLYDLNHYSDSLMGEHHNNTYESKYITKLIVSRQ